MKMLLTTKTIEHLQPEAKYFIAWDEALPRFGVRVSPKGVKTYVAVKGKARKIITVGRHPDLTLKAARTKAVLDMGDDSPEDQLSPKAAILAFQDAMKGRVKKDTLNQYLSYLNLMNLKSLELTYHDVIDCIKPWQGKPWAQNYAFASLRVFLNFCLEHGYIDKHPLIRKKAPNKTKSRDRVLSDEELGKIWRCAGDDTYGRLIRLLILTGQRRVEVRNLKPEDVADGLITFHTKGDRINVLPVTPLIKENLVLPFEFNNWSDAKRRLDDECGVSFRHHDLRRTLATKLAGMGVNFIVIERILGHAIPGVAGVYNRHSYLEECREALLLYENHIRKLSPR